MPTSICTNCLAELNAAYCFFVKYNNSAIKLKKILNLKENCFEVESEIICEEHSGGIPLEEHNHEKENVIHEYDNADANQIEALEPPCSNSYILFRCDVCGKVLKSEASLNRHVTLMHINRKHIGRVTGFGATRRHHCTKCSYTTPHSQTLANHMRKHNGERPYQCECGKSFTQSSSLAAHRKSHSSDTYFTCSTCGKQFKHAFALKKHLQVHEDASYSCNICQKRLKSKQTLKAHLLRHSNIRNYSCEECGDMFITSSELINHKKKHSSTKNIYCHLCGFKTNAKSVLIRHLRRHVGEKPYKCELCAVLFYTSSELKIHKRVHTREKPYNCPVCSQRFMHSTSVNKHMRTVHGIDYKWGDVRYKNLKKRLHLNNVTSLS